MKRKDIKDSVIIELYHNLKNCCKIARKLNCSYTLVRYRLIKNGFSTKDYKPSESLKGRIPWNKGLKGFGGFNKGKIRSEETKRKISESKKGCISPRKGVKLSKETIEKISNSLHTTGKRYKNRSDRYWSKIAKKSLEKYYGKLWNELYLPHHSIIHHIDGDKTNNLFSNLSIVSRSDHAKIHWQQGDIR